MQSALLELTEACLRLESQRTLQSFTLASDPAYLASIKRVEISALRCMSRSEAPADGLCTCSFRL